VSERATYLHWGRVQSERQLCRKRHRTVVAGPQFENPALMQVILPLLQRRRPVFDPRRRCVAGLVW
jgi:hypothetical protein